MRSLICSRNDRLHRLRLSRGFFDLRAFKPGARRVNNFPATRRAPSGELLTRRLSRPAFFCATKKPTAKGEITMTQQPTHTDEQIRAYLAQTGRIAILWGIDDVKAVRPDLSDDQCMKVLQECEHRHDAENGISWIVIETHANLLFPNAGLEAA